MKKSKLFLLSTAFVALASAPLMAEDLVIGLATAQTGGLAPYDQPNLAGLQMKIEEINAAGGIAGKFPIKTIIKDTRSDSAQTAMVAQELVDAGAQLIITPCDADPSIAAGMITQRAGIPATSLFPTPSPADNVQAAMLAAHAIEAGYKTAYILTSPDTAYTLKLRQYFGQVFAAKGGSILGEGTFTMGQQDFGAEVTKIAAMDPKPDVIMTSAYEPDFPAFVRQLRGAGVTTPILGSDGIDSPTTFGLGDLVEGVVFSTAGHATAGSPLEAFNAKWREKTGAAPDTIYIANGYDLGNIIEAAVTAADSLDPAAIREGIANLENLQGVTGPITYKGTNGMPLRSVSLVRIKAGDRDLVIQGQPDPADIPAP